MLTISVITIISYKKKQFTIFNFQLYNTTILESNTSTTNILLYIPPQ